MEMSYFEFMNELSNEELYRGLLGFGMFSDKLPPFFSSEVFFNYCSNNSQNFNNRSHKLVAYENMRNTNVPRHLSVPNPFAYQQLCHFLANNWGEILAHFERKTKDNRYRVSRIHIRKMLNRKYLFTMDYDDFIDAENSRESSLFDMNYKDYRVDGNPETDMLLGKRWIVKADISNCFLSIYSHSLAWALVGKDEAKANRDDAHWYNKIDILSRNVKDGETNGLPIGPHTSNLLSEIILIAIDNELHNGNNCWDYVRNIDDYTCYVDNREKAELFLTELNKQLSYYNLSLNHKKTEILELPIANTAHWTRQMEYLTHFERNGKLDYKSARSYLDVAIELMDKNDSNSSILKYAIKVLSNQNNFTDNAKAYIAKTMMNLSIIYPYLVSLLDECVFIPFAVDEEVIGKYCDVMLKSALRSCNYEAAAYCAYFAVKYGFTLADLNADVGIKSADCIFLTMLFLYFKTTKSESNINVLKQHAKSLINTDFDEYWIFVYESLSANDLPEHLSEWKDLKNHNVSFIRSL